MTFIEALYGSQYYEITQRGGDGNKGRLNGNLFLSAFIIILGFVFITILMMISAQFKYKTDHFFESIFGGMNGKTIGRLLAIPLLGIIYFVISKTIGNEVNYLTTVDRFMQYSDIEKEKANVKLLGPFFIALITLVVLSLINIR